MIILKIRPLEFYCDVAAVRKPAFVQTLIERGHKVCPLGGRSAVEEADHRHPGLLRSCREWPDCRTAEQRDELAAFHHSITSSASASSFAGISRPSALAVLRLITSSNLVACSTGRSDGLVPLRI